jgi:hypothetical protein
MSFLEIYISNQDFWERCGNAPGGTNNGGTVPFRAAESEPAVAAAALRRRT